MNSGHVAALPPASRSRLLNRALSGLDGRSAEGRAIRDIVASLLAEHGGDNAPIRLVLLARGAARAWIELQKLESLEATSAPAAIDRADDIARVAQKLGVAFRRFDNAIRNTPQGEHSSDSVTEYLKRKNLSEAATAA